MKTTLALTRTLAAWLCAAFIAPVALLAQADPAADAVLDQFVEALGGEAALARIESRVSKVEMAVPAAGMKFTMNTWQKAPDKYLVEQTIPGVGAVVQGFDGTTAWSLNPMQGYRELEGAERAQFVATADLHGEMNFKTKFPQRELLPEAKVGDRPAKVVRLAGAPEVPAMTAYFDAETHLLSRIEMVIDAGPQGQIPTSSDMSDYREVDGVKVAHLTKVRGGPMEMQMKVLEIQHNVPIDDARFAPRKE